MELVATGDGAGVGKGRTVAGIIYQNYLEGRTKAVWYVACKDRCHINHESVNTQIHYANYIHWWVKT